MLVIPMVVLLILLGIGLDQWKPALFLALMLQVVTMPMMATPSIAMMIGLDGTLPLIALILAGISMPILAPIIVALADAPIALSPLRLALLLSVTLAGSAAVGLALRALLSADRVARHSESIDGMNIIVLFVFVAAVMGDVGPAFLSDPLQMTAFTALAFVVNLAMFGATCIAFQPAGGRSALMLAIFASQRNLGLMLAVTGASLPETVWLYFAVSRFLLCRMVLRHEAGR